MEYITTKEASAKWGISPTRITILANQGRIPGAQRIGRSWLIPTEAAKPADLRSNHSDSSVEVSDADSFSFPMFPYRPDWDSGKEADLSDQKKNLLLAENDVLECRFKDAYALLETILQAPEDIGVEICGLYHAGICCIALNRPYDFSKFSLRMQMLLSDEFPHRDDFASTLDILKTYVESIGSAAGIAVFNTDIHYQCLPLRSLKIGYSILSKEIMMPGTADPAPLELILHFLETTSADVATESMHLYLLGIYYIRNNLSAAHKHARAAVQIAYEKKYYFPLVTLYRFFVPILSSVLERYPTDFQENIQTIYKQFVQNYAAFLSSINEYDIFSKLADADYPYLGAIMLNLPNKLIADRLGVSEHTVKRKLAEICAKLNVSNKKALRDFLCDYM